MRIDPLPTGAGRAAGPPQSMHSRPGTGVAIAIAAATGAPIGGSAGSLALGAGRWAAPGRIRWERA